MGWASKFMKFNGRIAFFIPDYPRVLEDELLNRLERQLRYENAGNLSRKGNHITFSGKIFRFRMLARFLSVADAGYFRVTTDEQHLIVEYRLSFL